MIRAARATDAPAIMEIWNAVIRDTTITFTPTELTFAEVELKLAGPHPFLVWEEGSQVSGFARYFPFRSGEGYRFTVEHSIMLAPSAQGRGVGRALMLALFEHAVQADIHAMVAGISAENADAIAFHAIMGFETVATMPEVGFKFGRWIDLVLMQKRF